jgi:hypothetical protein
VALFHEATHQLTFNTGLLDRRADVPLCISEGLGMYGEVRRPTGQVKIGAVNTERVKVLGQMHQQNLDWLTAEQLLRDDGWLAPEHLEQMEDTVKARTLQRQQQAYAQSWLLVHHLLKADKPAAFRDYLDLLRRRRNAETRVEDATRCLGDLAKLDQELKKSAAKLVRR